MPYQLVGPEPKDERNRALAPADAVGHDHLSWLDRMVRTTAPSIERMTLIWHDWFATSNLGVASQRLMLDQVDMFRGNAFGSFKDLLLNVTKDPAMLVWLNGNQNIRQQAERELRARADGALHARRRTAAPTPRPTCASRRAR